MSILDKVFKRRKKATSRAKGIKYTSLSGEKKVIPHEELDKHRPITSPLRAKAPTVKPKRKTVKHSSSKPSKTGRWLWNKLV